MGRRRWRGRISSRSRDSRSGKCVGEGRRAGDFAPGAVFRYERRGETGAAIVRGAQCGCPDERRGGEGEQVLAEAGGVTRRYTWIRRARSGRTIRRRTVRSGSCPRSWCWGRGQQGVRRSDCGERAVPCAGQTGSGGFAAVCDRGYGDDGGGGDIAEDARDVQSGPCRAGRCWCGAGAVDDRRDA